MMLKKEMLDSILGLDYHKKINAMSDRDFEKYCCKLENFVEAFPNLEKKIKRYFKTGALGNLEKQMSELKDMLSEIHAVELEDICKKVSEEVKNPNKNAAEAALTAFFMNVSTLSIEIQMAKYKEDELPKEKPKHQKEGLLTVLAVDDVSLLLVTIRTFLENSQYKFVGVTSGAAALKFVQSHEVDLFLLDIEMPEMNGYELAAELKKLGATAPVIFLTGNAQKDYVLKAIQTGAVDFIVKPANKEQVLEKINKYIG